MPTAELVYFWSFFNLLQSAITGTMSSSEFCVKEGYVNISLETNYNECLKQNFSYINVISIPESCENTYFHVYALL